MIRKDRKQLAEVSTATPRLAVAPLESMRRGCTMVKAGELPNWLPEEHHAEDRGYYRQGA